MKLTGERRLKYLRRKYSQPGMKEIREGSLGQIEAILSRLESEGHIARESYGQSLPAEKRICENCGEKYESAFEQEYCPECREAGKLDSGDYEFGADEDA